MDPVKNLIGDYHDEVGAQVDKAKKSKSASSADDIVKNIV